MDFLRNLFASGINKIASFFLTFINFIIDFVKDSAYFTYQIFLIIREILEIILSLIQLFWSLFVGIYNTLSTLPTFLNYSPSGGVFQSNIDYILNIFCSYGGDYLFHILTFFVVFMTMFLIAKILGAEGGR